MKGRAGFDRKSTKACPEHPFQTGDEADLCQDTSSANPAFARCFVAGALTMLVTLLFNGPLFSAHEGVFAWSRDESTLVTAAVLMGLLAVALWRPREIRPCVFTVASIVIGVAGHFLCFWGVSCSSEVAIVAGSACMGVADAWGIVIWLLACAMLERRRACLCLAASGLVSLPFAYMVNMWAPYAAISVISAAASAAIPLLCFPITGPFFSRLASLGIPAEQQIVRPQAFIPFGHAFYVYIFAFSLAYGFALRCKGVESPEVISAVTFVSTVCVSAYAIRARNALSVDALFVASFFVVAVGFMLVLLSDERIDAVSSALLVAGYTCFELVVWFAICGAAARNTVDAIPTICWGTAIGYVGICVGAGLWIVPNLLLEPILMGNPVLDVPLLQGIVVVVVLSALVLYTLLTRRLFSFDETIDGIAPDPVAPRVDVRYVDRLDECCDVAVARFGLTAREGEVMRMLAHGRDSARIQDELGIGRNTVKYHAKNVYAKLGVHSQQELIDLVGRLDAFAPAPPDASVSPTSA